MFKILDLPISHTRIAVHHHVSIFHPMAHLTFTGNSSIGAPLINIGAHLIVTLSNPKGCLMHRIDYNQVGKTGSGDAYLYHARDRRDGKADFPVLILLALPRLQSKVKLVSFSFAFSFMPFR